MSNAIDLTGKRFGRLVALERAEDIRYENGAIVTQWKCQCDCGKVVIKRTQGLMNGKSKSCGCLRKEMGNKPFVYQIGSEICTKYSRFKVLELLREKRKSSNILDKKYRCHCLECGEEQVILEHTLTSKIGSCRACSDIRSYPAKFFYWFMRQTGITFETEYSPEWIGRKRFDFYFVINGKEYIVEIDGAQHCTHGHKRLTVEEVIRIDREKDALAKEHGILVIRLDCRESKGKLIVESMKNTVLSELFNFNTIDWAKCSYMAISNSHKRFLDLWNTGQKSTTEISEITGSNANHISKCLQECAFYGLCDYDPVQERYRGAKQSTNGKPIRCLDTGNVYDSAEDCSRQSLEVLGVFLKGSGITKVCRNERKQYKGFHFEYV